MDFVEFSGVKYLRASMVAKQFSYTPDYIGQLCRSKKVDARLVGRTWFVNPLSVEKHKSEKYSSKVLSRSTENSPADYPQAVEKSFKIKLERVEETPILHPQPSKSLEATVETVAIKTSKSATRQLAVTYEPDESSLLPKLHKVILPPPTTLPVSIAEAQKVKVRATKKSHSQVNFKAEPLPEVQLRGEIAVSAVPEFTPQIVTDSIANADPNVSQVNPDSHPSSSLSSRDNHKNKAYLPTRVTSFEGEIENKSVRQPILNNDQSLTKTKKSAGLLADDNRQQRVINHHPVNQPQKVELIRSDQPTNDRFIDGVTPVDLPAVYPELKSGIQSRERFTWLPFFSLAMALLIAVGIISYGQSIEVSDAVLEESVFFVNPMQLDWSVLFDRWW